MSSSDREALLAAVIASPDDDVPRLVYADYLDDLGGEANAARAAFIRAEIAAELLPADDPERERLETEAAGLFNRFGKAWNEELLGWESRSVRVRYRRGFVDEVAAITHRLNSIEARYVAAPWTWLRIVPTSDMWTWPTNWTMRLDRVRTFQLGPKLDCQYRTESEYGRELITDQICRTFHEPSLTGVVHLILNGNRVNNAMIEIVLRALPAAPFLPTLRSLDLSDNLLTDAGLAYLAAARGLERITQVNVRGNPITAAGVDMLRARFGDGVIV